VHGAMVKYGVVSTRSVLHDLHSWSSLYVAGRLHKPVRARERRGTFQRYGHTNPVLIQTTLVQRCIR
jgi:hypothetical protein